METLLEKEGTNGTLAALGLWEADVTKVFGEEYRVLASKLCKWVIPRLAQEECFRAYEYYRKKDTSLAELLKIEKGCSDYEHATVFGEEDFPETTMMVQYPAEKRMDDVNWEASEQLLDASCPLKEIVISRTWQGFDLEETISFVEECLHVSAVGAAKVGLDLLTAIIDDATFNLVNGKQEEFLMRQKLRFQKHLLESRLCTELGDHKKSTEILLESLRIAAEISRPSYSLYNEHTCEILMMRLMSEINIFDSVLQRSMAEQIKVDSIQYYTAFAVILLQVMSCQQCYEDHSSHVVCNFEEVVYELVHPDLQSHLLLLAKKPHHYRSSSPDHKDENTCTQKSSLSKENLVHRDSNRKILHIEESKSDKQIEDAYDNIRIFNERQTPNKKNERSKQEEEEEEDDVTFNASWFNESKYVCLSEQTFNIVCLLACCDCLQSMTENNSTDSLKTLMFDICSDSRISFRDKLKQMFRITVDGGDVKTESRRHPDKECSGEDEGYADGISLKEGSSKKPASDDNSIQGTELRKTASSKPESMMNVENQDKLPSDEFMSNHNETDTDLVLYLLKAYSIDLRLRKKHWVHKEMICKLPLRRVVEFLERRLYTSIWRETQEKIVRMITLYRLYHFGTLSFERVRNPCMPARFDTDFSLQSPLSSIQLMFTQCVWLLKMSLSPDKKALHRVQSTRPADDNARVGNILQSIIGLNKSFNHFYRSNVTIAADSLHAKGSSNTIFDDAVDLILKLKQFMETLMSRSCPSLEEEAKFVNSLKRRLEEITSKRKLFKYHLTENDILLFKVTYENRMFESILLLNISVGYFRKVSLMQLLLRMLFSPLDEALESHEVVSMHQMLYESN